MNPETNRFETLDMTWRAMQERSQLVRPNGQPVPPHWPVFSVGELVTLKDYTFRVAYINEGTLLLEPVRPEDALTSNG